MALTCTTLSATSLTSPVQRPTSPFSVETMLVIGVHLSVYASGSITIGGASTTAARFIEVVGKVFMVFLIVKSVTVVTLACTTTKTSVDCLITRYGRDQSAGLVRVAAPLLRELASSSGFE